MATFLIGFENATFPSDLSGTKLALAGRITEAEVEAIGGVPVRMPFGELYTALQFGVIDGIAVRGRADRDAVLKQLGGEGVYALVDGTDGDMADIPTANSDDLTGSKAQDVVHLLRGSDTYHARGGNDRVWGDGGNDVIYGGSGADRLWGGAGRDRLFGDGGRDTLIGGSGTDRLNGAGGNDVLEGGKGGDRLAGDAGRDRLFGDAGRDKLFGDGGSDRLTGGAGKDLLDGGRGHDMMTGGRGADIFVFNTVGAKNQDTITDFRKGVDIIRLDDADYSIGKSDGNVVLRFGGGESLTLEGLNSKKGLKASIDAPDVEPEPEPEVPAGEIKLGVLLGFTGPIESLTDTMAVAAERAMAEVSESGLLLGGLTVTSARADSSCIDVAAATRSAEFLIDTIGVAGIVGPACSGATSAVAQNVAVPSDMVVVSPAASLPDLASIEDDGLFFRMAVSDDREGEIMSAVLRDQGVKRVAVTYTDNSYGEGLADNFVAAFEAAGGKVTISAEHQNGKMDYSSEIAALDSAGGQRLVVIGYPDQGAAEIVQASLDAGAFDTFHFSEAMLGDRLVSRFGSELAGSTSQVEIASPKGARLFNGVAGTAFDPDAAYAQESYDATAVILLAMQAAGSADPAVYKDYMDDVANGDGTKIFAGELGKGLRILKRGGEIDYVGASGVEFDAIGDTIGTYREIAFRNGQIETDDFIL